MGSLFWAHTTINEMSDFDEMLLDAFMSFTEIKATI